MINEDAQLAPREGNPTDLLIGMLRSASQEVPPIVALGEKRTYVAHRVSAQEGDVHALELAETMLTYVVLGLERAIFALNVRKVLSAEKLELVVANVSLANSYICRLHGELDSLQKQLSLIPLISVPVAIGIDVLTSTVTPPLTETTVCVLANTRIIALIMKIRRIKMTLLSGHVVFTERPQLRKTEEALLAGDYSASLSLLDACDGIPEHSPQNSLYVPAHVNLAEQIQVSDERTMRQRLIHVAESVATWTHHNVNHYRGNLQRALCC